MRRAPVLALLLVAAGLAAVFPLYAQSRPDREQRAARSAVAAPLYDQLAELRGIASPGPPPPVLVRSRAVNRRFLEQQTTPRSPQAPHQAERKSLVAWRVLPADSDLQRLFLDLLEEQVSAYYDP